MRTGNRLTVHLALRRDSTEHLSDQLAAQLTGAIRNGTLRAGTRLPSTRDLAGLLGVSRGVVLTAYQILLARGHVEGRPGSGTYVCRAPVEERPRRAPAVHCRPPATGPFPLAAWRAAWRGASYRPPVGEPDPLGSPVLREAVADHLRRTRGVRVEADRVVVTGGVRQACWLLFEAIRQHDGSAPVVAVEQPAPPYPVLAARQAGGRAVALPVDEDGARLDRLPGARCAVVFAEGNEPLGTVLSVDRRRALLAWSEREGGYVADVCGERAGTGTGLPLPPLTGDRVALIGTLGDALAPPGLTYLVPPRHLLPLIAASAAHDDGRPGDLVQAAYARLVGDGTVSARAERAARVHARRRAQAHAAAERLPCPARLVTSPRGPFAAVLLPGHVAAAVREELTALGVCTTPLGAWYQLEPGTARDGLVLDAGARTEEEWRSALDTVAAVVATLGGAAGVRPTPPGPRIDITAMTFHRLVRTDPPVSGGIRPGPAWPPRGRRPAGPGR